MNTPRSPLNPHRYRRMEALILGLFAFAAAMMMASGVFSWQTVTGDEGSYLFQANCLRDGLLKRDCPVFHPLLRYDMIILRPDAGWVSRYPPGHGLWLVPGVLAGIPQLMSALAAALTVVCGYEIGRRLRFPRFLLPTLLLLSPFFLFMHGTLLSHTSGLTTVSVMFLSYLIWRQDRKAVWALLAGLAWAFYFTNRTWTALLIAVPFGLDCLYHLRKDRKNVQTWLGTVLFAAGASVGVGLYLAYNAAVTGDAGTPTYLYYEASENLGFGARRTQGGTEYQINHTFQAGMEALWRNLGLLDRWSFGSRGSLVIWFILLIHGWSRRWSLLLLGAGLCVCGGYVAFWYPGITDVGPVYYTEILLFFLVLAGFGLSRIWRRLETKVGLRTFVFSVLGLLLLLSSASFSFVEAKRLQEQLTPRVQMQEVLDGLPENSLVFANSLPGRENKALDHYIGLNPRGLKSDPLILRSRGPNDAHLADHFPDRSAWQLKFKDQLFSVSPLSRKDAVLKRGASNTHHERGVGRTENGERIATDGKDGKGLLVYGWYTYLAAGDYEVRFDIQWEGVAGDKPVVLELAYDQGREIAVRQELSEGLGRTSLPFRLEELGEVEPRIIYGGSGNVRVRSIELVRPAEEAKKEVGDKS